MTPASLRAQSRIVGWVLGLPALAAILAAALTWSAPQIERRVAGAADAIARSGEGEGGEPWLRASAHGRDVLAEGEAPDAQARAAAASRLAAIPGLRRLVDRMGIVADASPFVWVAARAETGDIALSGHRPAEIGSRALAAALAPSLPAASRLGDRAKAARGAPPDFLAAARYAVERLGGLRPGAVATLRDTVLTVSGEAADPDSYDALRVALTQPPEGFTLGDSAILPPVVANFAFSVSRSADGGMALSGNVVSEAARASLQGAAALAANGGAVDDRTRTARGLPAGIDADALTSLSLKIAELMQEGGIALDGATLSVAGIAIDAQAVPEIEGLIRDGRPAGIEAGTVTLSTRPLTPYKTAIRREADTVTVSGHLPDQAARERLAAALRPRFFQERVIDKSRIAEGAAPGLAAALEAMAGPLSTLRRGEVSASGRQIRLTGESLYAESARAIENAAPRQAPVGWAASAAITGPAAPMRRDAASCAILLDRAAEGRAPRFAPGSAALRPEFHPLLDALAALAETCPGSTIEVTGHADPAGPAPAAQKPVIDSPVVEMTASVEPRPAAPPVKPLAAKPTIEKPTIEKSVAEKPKPAAAAKAETKKAEPRNVEAKKTDAKPAPAKTAAADTPPPAPEPDLPRQRASAIVDYLLKAGAPADRVVVAPNAKPRPEREGVGFALRS